MEYFLANVCTPDWNEQQDAGRPFAEAVGLLQEQFPQYHEWIAAFDDRWLEMLGEEDLAVVAILRQIKEKYGPVFALTNWSAEKFPHALRRFDFLQWFEGIIVSGEEGLKKPDHRIYELLNSRFGLNLAEAVFIDDAEKNVRGAKAAGLLAIHFRNAGQLKADLQALGLRLG